MKKNYIDQPPNFCYTILDYFNVFKEMKNISNKYKKEKTDIRKMFEQKFCEYLNIKYCCSVATGNIALDLAIECLNIKDNDEIISPAINFYGSQLCILRKTKKIVLCKVDPKTLNIDVMDLEKKINENTKAIIVTHMNGVCCNVEEIKKLIKSQNHKIYIIEDVARSLGSEYDGKKAGTFGDLSIFSFQQKKNFSTLGEGGVICTNNLEFYKKITSLRSFGLKKDWGTNFRLSRVQCAVGLSQIKKIDVLNSKRIKVAKERNRLFEDKKLDITLPSFDTKEKAIYTYYTVILNSSFSKIQRNNIRLNLQKKYNIETCIANEPTYKTHLFIKKNFPKEKIDFKLGERIISLPIHYKMKQRDNKYIVNSFCKEYQIEKEKIEKERITNILKKYNVVPKNISYINKGYACKKWLIESNKKYILKEMKINNVNRINYINEIQNKVVQKNIAPKIFKSNNKSFYVKYLDNIYIMYEYIKGNTPEHINFYKLGQYLNKIHFILNDNNYKTKEIDYFEIKKPRLKEMNILLKQCKFYEKKYHILLYKIEKIKKANYDISHLNKGIIHGDFYKDNILINSNKIYLLDFDQSCLFYREYEIIRAMVKFCYKTRINNSVNFIKGYIDNQNIKLDIKNAINFYLYMQLNDLYCLTEKEYNVKNNKKYAIERFNQIKWLENKKNKIIKRLEKEYES